MPFSGPLETYRAFLICGKWPRHRLFRDIIFTSAIRLYNIRLRFFNLNVLLGLSVGPSLNRMDVMQVLTILHVIMIQVKGHRIVHLASVMVEVQAAIVALLDLQVDLQVDRHQVGPSLGNTTNIRRDYTAII